MRLGPYHGKVALGASAALLAMTMASTGVFAQPTAVAPDATASATTTTASTASATATPSATATGTATASPTASATVLATATTTATPAGTATATATSTPSALRDERFFPQTGYRIDNDTIWDYFNRRGGVTSFGYPTSRVFTLQGFQVQFFQRRIVQLDNNGRARLLNILDPGLLPYTNFNGSTFPGVDSALVASAPDPRDQRKTLEFVRDHAPDTFNGRPVNFYQTFLNSVSEQVAFPRGGDRALLPGIALELWGIPTSAPIVDPNNSNFIYLRFQRGIMHYDAACNCTQGILLADYLKAILTGQNLPMDVDQESKDSPFYRQYDPSQPKSVRNESQLPDSDLTNAFTQQ